MADNKLDISSTAVEKTIDLASGFLNSIVKEPLQELGGILTDKIKMYRALLQAKSVLKVSDKCKKEGIDPKQLNMKVLVPYLDAVAIEEDEELHEVWANLITNYLDPTKTIAVTVYPHILKQLSTPEVKALKYLNSIEDHRSISFTDECDGENYLLKTGELILSKDVVANMERLGLVIEVCHVLTPKDEVETELYQKISGRAYGTFGIGLYEITMFGREFVKACTRDGQ